MKSFKIIICVLIISLTFTGCMNSVHLKDMMVVEGLGVDVADDEISVSVQTLNASEASSGESMQGNMTVVTAEKGNTVYHAISNLGNYLSKKIFFGQNKLIVFSRDLAETQFDVNIDYFLRSSDSRPDVAVCLSDSKAQDIIESKENDTHVPIEDVVYLIKNGQDSGKSMYITVGEFLNIYYDKTSDISIPMLEMDDETKNAKLKGIGIFNKDKLVYVTNDNETKGYTFIKGKIKTTSIEFEDKDLGKIVVDILNPKVKNRTEIRDGKVVFITEIKAELMINEIENGILISLDKEKMERIRRLACDKVEILCRKSFYACQNHGSDAFRVGEYLAKDNPKSYELVSEQWDDYFPTVEYEVSADIALKKISDNTQLD